MGKHVFSEQYYQEHRRLASHLEAVYIEIEKLAKKKSIILPLFWTSG
jgi:hypothetical protein